MNFELRELRWAILAAEYGSLRQAAEALHIRQSTLSRSLRGLEHDFGQVLFERSHGGTRPTAEGLEFLDVAQRIVVETEELGAHFKGRQHGHTGRLTVGIHTSFSTGNLRATLLDYQKRFPGVKLCLADGSSEHLLSGLGSSAVDIAFIVGTHRRWRGRSLPVWSERVVVALPEGHPLGSHDAIHWGDLKDEQILLAQHGPGSEFYQLIVSRIGDAGACHIQYHDTALDRVLTLVSAGYGVLFALDGATGVTYPGVIFREVHDTEGPVRLHFRVYWRQANSNPALGPFLDILRERYPDLSGAP
ncbi:MAG: LysR family transcriptional regulator [Rhodopila sp.]|nr:LysR family transcriptional regulator [Rhodopila sp.]